MMQRVSVQLGLDEPSVVITSTDGNIKQLLQCAEEIGDDLKSTARWPELTQEDTITLVADQATYTFPTDYDRYINFTGWAQDDDRILDGPLSLEEYMDLKEGVTGSTLYRKYLIDNNRLTLYPTPTTAEAGNTCVLKYQSINWILDTDASTTKARFAADTDTPLLPEHTVELGMKYLFRYYNGIEFELDRKKYEDEAQRRSGMSRGGRLLNLSPPRGGARRISWRNLPDSGYSD